MSDPQSQSVAISEADLEAMIAHYAPIGRRLRQRRQLIAVALVLLVTVLGVTGMLNLYSRKPVAENASLEHQHPGAAGTTAAGEAERIERALGEIEEIKASLQAETSAVTAQRSELDRQKEAVARKDREVAAQLAAVAAQREALAKQHDDLEQQKLKLIAALEKTNAQRRQLQASTGSRAMIERDLLELDRQRRTLEEQKREFNDKGEAPATRQSQLPPARAAREALQALRARGLSAQQVQEAVKASGFDALTSAEYMPGVPSDRTMIPL